MVIYMCPTATVSHSRFSHTLLVVLLRRATCTQLEVLSECDAIITAELMKLTWTCFWGVLSCPSHAGLEECIGACVQIVDLLTWKAEAGAQMASLWGVKDNLQRSELTELLSTADDSQQMCGDVGNDATSARVLAIIFCHNLAQTAGVSPNRAGGVGNSGSPSSVEAAAATSAGVLLLQRLVDVMQKDLAVQAGVPFKGSDVHRKKVRVWQALSVLAAFSQVNESCLRVEDVVGHLMQPELASVKQYQETGGLLATFLPFIPHCACMQYASYFVQFVLHTVMLFQRLKSGYHRCGVL